MRPDSAPRRRSTHRDLDSRWTERVALVIAVTTLPITIGALTSGVAFGRERERPQITAARPADAQALAALDAEAFGKEHGWPASFWREMMASGAGTIEVVRGSNGKLLSAAVTWDLARVPAEHQHRLFGPGRIPARKRGLYVASVATSGEGRGQGYASALLERAKVEAARRGEPLYLHVTTKNPAQKLYAKLGFTYRLEGGGFGPVTAPDRQPLNLGPHASALKKDAYLMRYNPQHDLPPARLPLALPGRRFGR